MTRIMMAFGDSNTHGSPPITQRGVYQRYPATVRWPTVADAALGDGWSVIEAGLPGRTAARDCPIMGAHMNGQTGLRIALESHGPIDLLVLMLGTNDLKTFFGLTPSAITGGVASLLSMAQTLDYQVRHGGFEILLMCPPPVLEQGPIAADFFGASEKSKELPQLYADLANNRGVHFLNAGDHIASSPVDGIHFDEATQITLGKTVAGFVATL